MPQYDLHHPVIHLDNEEDVASLFPGDEEVPSGSFSNVDEDRWVDFYLKPTLTASEAKEAFRVRDALLQSGRLQAATDRALGMKVRLEHEETTDANADEDRWVELFLRPPTQEETTEAYRLQTKLARAGRLTAATDRAIGQRIRQLEEVKAETGIGGPSILAEALPHVYRQPEQAEAQEPEYEPITLEAHGLVFGDRNRDYGHPIEDFGRTASYWTAHLGDKLKLGESVTAEDVGILMCLLKLSRQRNKSKRDNLVDLAGYAETVQRIIDFRKGVKGA